jgi:hypothetical protein
MRSLGEMSDPHQPPEFVNRRARDIVDLVLLRRAFYVDDPDIASLREACVALFEARAAEVEILGGAPRSWPPVLSGSYDSSVGRFRRLTAR